MNNNNTIIEQRLRNMKNFYIRAGELVDELPESVPKKTRAMIKDVILGDKELKELMDGIESNRPPRIFLIGRTGVGKSSLVNALCGAYIAPVSDTKSCTEKSSVYKCELEGRVLMEIFDTRGIAESEALDDTVSAEQMLIEEINEFSPDVAIMMLNCTHRDDIVSDVEFMKTLAAEYERVNSVRLPIVAVVNKSDEMAPARHKCPDSYPENKVDKIQEVVAYYEGIIAKNGLVIDNILAVSSLIDWMTPDGVEIDVEDIESLPDGDADNLQIAFDGRYQIEELLDVLEDAILDFEARMGLRMAARLNEVVRRISVHLSKIFAGISAAVAVTPIPISDIYVLLVLQSVMVTLIQSLSGRESSFESATEFIFSVGGVGLAGFGFRVLAQQSSKLLNVLWPGSGSAVSSAVAFGGTMAMGRAAVAYYVDGQSLEFARLQMKEDD